MSARAELVRQWRLRLAEVTGEVRTVDDVAAVGHMIDRLVESTKKLTQGMASPEPMHPFPRELQSRFDAELAHEVKNWEIRTRVLHSLVCAEGNCWTERHPDEWCESCTRMRRMLDAALEP